MTVESLSFCITTVCGIIFSFHIDSYHLWKCLRNMNRSSANNWEWCNFLQLHLGKVISVFYGSRNNSQKPVLRIPFHFKMKWNPGWGYLHKNRLDSQRFSYQDNQYIQYETGWFVLEEQVFIHYFSLPLSQRSLQSPSLPLPATRTF